MNTLTDRQRDCAADGSHERMNEAWQWLCEQRTAAPDNGDVWHLRWQQLTAGPAHLTRLLSCLLRGEYRLSPLQLFGQGEQRKAVWGAQDALVLKWVALSLWSQFPLHPSCEHIAGHGGGRKSIERLHGLLNAADIEKKTGQENATAPPRRFRWVCRTDIRGYYRNINKATLLSQVKRHVSSLVLCDLVEQYLHYTVEDSGTFHTPEKGISRGGALSTLMGALHLYDMDEHFSKQKNIHYARYMDDVIILAKSRRQLRKHTKRLMQWFSEYGFEAHPEKMQIGRTEKGFDSMGAWLTHEGVTDIDPRAKANHSGKVRRLYEGRLRVPLWAQKRERQRTNARVSTYRKRWTIWAAMIMAPTAPWTAAHAGWNSIDRVAVPDDGTPLLVATLRGTTGGTPNSVSNVNNIGIYLSGGPRPVTSAVCNGTNYRGYAKDGVMLFATHLSMDSHVTDASGKFLSLVLTTSPDGVMRHPNEDGFPPSRGIAIAAQTTTWPPGAYNRINAVDAASASADVYAVSCSNVPGYLTNDAPTPIGLVAEAGGLKLTTTISIRAVTNPSCNLSASTTTLVFKSSAQQGPIAQPVTLSLACGSYRVSTTAGVSFAASELSTDGYSVYLGTPGPTTPTVRGSVRADGPAAVNCSGNDPSLINFNGTTAYAEKSLSGARSIYTQWVACPALVATPGEFSGHVIASIVLQ